MKEYRPVKRIRFKEYKNHFQSSNYLIPQRDLEKRLNIFCNKILPLYNGRTLGRLKLPKTLLLPQQRGHSQKLCSKLTSAEMAQFIDRVTVS